MAQGTKTGGHKPKKYNTKKIYGKLVFDFIFYFLLMVLIALGAKVLYGIRWYLSLPVCFIAAFLIVFMSNRRLVTGFFNLAYVPVCNKCGFLNKKKAYYCVRCGVPLEKNLERISLVYYGIEPTAFFLYTVLNDAGIPAWKNSMRYKIPFMYSDVYVFEEHAEEAIKIMTRITGEISRDEKNF